MLLDAGADIEAKNNGGSTPLHRVAYNKDPAVLRVILDAGADVHAKDYKGRTPLFGAANASSPAAVQSLLDAGANVHAKNYNGRTPLVSAIAARNLATIPVLLEAGADIHAKDHEGSTPLHWSVGESPAVVQTLLDAGADAEAKDNEGKTPLHWAATDAEDRTVISVLLDAGADIEAKDNSGMTPLHWAAFKPRTPAVVEVLLEAGADVEAKDNEGRTPLDHASNPAVMDLLRTATFTPTPEPTATFTPIPEPDYCSAADVEYASELWTLLGVNSLLNVALSTLLAEAEDDPLVILSEDWRGRMTLTAERYVLINDGILKLEAPASASELEAAARQMATALKGAARNYMLGYVNLDATAIELGGQQFGAAANALSRVVQELEIREC